jgi:hypothetical protein
VKSKLRCRCGHPRSEHTLTTGPNSIGQFYRNLCTRDWEVSGGHRFGFGCACYGFRLRWWRPWGRVGVSRDVAS